MRTTTITITDLIIVIFFSLCTACTQNSEIVELRAEVQELSDRLEQTEAIMQELAASNADLRQQRDIANSLAHQLDQKLHVERKAHLATVTTLTHERQELTETREKLKASHDLCNMLQDQLDRVEISFSDAKDRLQNARTIIGRHYKAWRSAGLKKRQIDTITYRRTTRPEYQAAQRRIEAVQHSSRVITELETKVDSLTRTVQVLERELQELKGRNGKTDAPRESAQIVDVSKNNAHTGTSAAHVPQGHDDPGGGLMTKNASGLRVVEVRL